MKEFSYKDLSLINKKLLKEAFRVMKKSYNPYSNFFVGASVLNDANKIFSGSNVENSSFGSTICAEASALMNARSSSLSKIKTIAIIAKNGDSDILEPISPCGNCRQIILEFSKISNYDIDVIMSNTKMSKIIIAKISELLPLAFNFSK